MKAFQIDFSDRKQQVRHYLAVVIRVERGSGLGRMTRAQERRLLTLRAGAFLLAYNLIEATTRGAVAAIHDKIITDKVAFGSLRRSLREECIKRFKRGADHKFDYSAAGFPVEFVSVALDVGVKLSGNVDAKYIRELGDCYGFSCATDRDVTWNGADLLTIKDKRNELGHGLKTFEEVGRDYPSRELLMLMRRSMLYMETILKNVEQYLDSASYLEA